LRLAESARHASILRGLVEANASLPGMTCIESSTVVAFDYDLQ
jgi:hypothetical protein